MSSALASNAVRRRADLIRVGLAACLVGVFVWKWELVQILFRTTPWSVLGAVTVLFEGLLIASLVGLLNGRSWGFYCAYLLVPVSTILHGVALVPFVPDLLPGGLRIGSVAVLNVAFLVVVALNHRTYRRMIMNLEATREPATG